VRMRESTDREAGPVMCRLRERAARADRSEEVGTAISTRSRPDDGVVEFGDDKAAVELYMKAPPGKWVIGGRTT
jgi:hypothetical protein